MTVTRFLASALLAVAVAAALAAAQTCTYDVPPPLETINAPKPDAAALAASTFSIDVRSNATLARAYAGATFNGAAAPQCNFPGGDFSSAFDDDECEDVFSAAVDFSVLTAPAASGGCGFAIDESDADYFRWSGLYGVRIEDQVAGTRSGDVETRSSTFQWFVDVALPKSVSVTFSPLEIFAPIVLDAVIVRQDVDAAAGTLEVDILTEVQHPFSVDDWAADHVDYYSPIAVTSVTAADATAFDAAYTCDDSDGSPCFQLITMTMVRNAACDYDGDYAATASLVCQPSQGDDCPLDDGAAATISFTLETGDVCEVVTVEEAGSLSAAAVPRDGVAYLDGAGVVFDVTAASTAAAIASTTVNPTVAWEEVGNAAGNAGTIGANAVSTSANSVAVSMTLDAAAFNVPADASLRFAFTFEVGVTYADGARRRSLLQSEGGNAVARSTVQLTAAAVVDGGAENDDDGDDGQSPAAPGGDSSTVAMAGMFVGVVGVLFGVALVVVLVAVRRRRSDDDKKGLPTSSTATASSDATTAYAYNYGTSASGSASGSASAPYGYGTEYGYASGASASDGVSPWGASSEV